MSTNFVYGLKSRGVPVETLGGTRYYGFWTGNSWFVDYDNGADGNTGKGPDSAVKTLDKAITLCGAMDVIYIRPRDVSGTDPQGIVPDSSTINWTVGHAKEGIAIIGAGPVIGMGVHYTYLKGAASGTTGPVLDIQSPGVTIENLAFHRGGVTSVGLLRLYGDGTAANNAHNSSVNNCMFRFWNQAEDASAAIVVQDSWWCTIINCEFYECNNGIWLYGVQSSVKGTTIRDSVFRGAAANVSADIIMQGGAMDFTVFDNIVFAHQIPTGGSNVYIKNVASGTTTDGILTRLRFGDNITVGTEIPTFADGDIVDCYDAAGAINTGS